MYPDPQSAYQHENIHSDIPDGRLSSDPARSYFLAASDWINSPTIKGVRFILLIEILLWMRNLYQTTSHVVPLLQSRPIDTFIRILALTDSLISFYRIRYKRLFRLLLEVLILCFELYTFWAPAFGTLPLPREDGIKHRKSSLKPFPRTTTDATATHRDGSLSARIKQAGNQLLNKIQAISPWSRQTTLPGNGSDGVPLVSPLQSHQPEHSFGEGPSSGTFSFGSLGQSTSQAKRQAGQRKASADDIEELINKIKIQETSRIQQAKDRALKLAPYTMWIVVVVHIIASATGSLKFLIPDTLLCGLTLWIYKPQLISREQVREVVKTRNKDALFEIVRAGYLTYTIMSNSLMILERIGFFEILLYMPLLLYRIVTENFGHIVMVLFRTAASGAAIYFLLLK
eukprot:TRINITY_DN4070_c0_g2_i2.p1 TRINITY_DN4070_c0_g2~~TRINITY_DN4070_c0_g2_i2.p1  ORF type:complete len:400 (+),score=55.93 TRINITY_DN4070_c0_g2_i2:879-2078(+)